MCAGLSSVLDEMLVSSDNLAPTANAGENALVITGTTAALDGSASTDPEGDPLMFTWSIDSAPAGSSAMLSGTASPVVYLTPDVDGVYEIQLGVSDYVGLGDPDSVTVTATSASSYAEIKLLAAFEYISGLPDESFAAPGHRNMTNQLSHAVQDLEEDDLDHAGHDIGLLLERSDGCAVSGSPDGGGQGRDWIANCIDQAEVYTLLIDALAAIAP
jgi:K319L-like, PKD domain